MKKQTIKGFIGTKIDIIDDMQSKGFYLQSIYEEVKKDFPEDIAFRTFKDALYKIRNASKNKIVSNSSNMEMQNIDNTAQEDKTFKWNPNDKSNIDF